MTKILVCEGPPPHEWEHPGGRGRPPKFCPEHHPSNLGRLRETDQGAVAGDDLLSDPHVTAGGQEQPIAPSAPNPFIERAKRQQRLSNLEHAREVKSDKAREAENRRLADMRSELETIDGRIEKADEAYGEAFEAACKSQGYVAELWDRADAKQTALLNALSRRSIIQRDLKNPKVEAVPVPALTGGI